MLLPFGADVPGKYATAWRLSKRAYQGAPCKDNSVLKQERTCCLFRNGKEKNQKRDEPRINGGDTQARQTTTAGGLKRRVLTGLLT